VEVTHHTVGAIVKGLGLGMNYCVPKLKEGKGMWKAGRGEVFYPRVVRTKPGKNERTRGPAPGDAWGKQAQGPAASAECN